MANSEAEVSNGHTQHLHTFLADPIHGKFESPRDRLCSAGSLRAAIRRRVPRKWPPSWLPLPNRPGNGEGCIDREETGAGARHSPTNEHLIRSTGVLSTACREGGLGQ